MGGKIMRLKWDENEIKKYVESQNYKFIGILKFKALNSRILIQCEHGHIFVVCFKNFKGNKALKGTRCPVCFGMKQPSIKDIENKLNNDGFKLLSEYENAKTKLKIQCKNGHITYRTWSGINRVNKVECTKCANGRESITINSIQEFLNKFNYKLLSEEYKNAHEKLKIQCDKGHIFYKNWNKLQNGQKCPICNISKGEYRIMSYLKNNNIKFIYDEPYFDDLLSDSNNPLRPDFILPNERIWIEYDGEFHYKNSYKDGGYEKLQKHDEMKNEYAKENNWNLIRIPYWEYDNIEKILDKIINK